MHLTVFHINVNYLENETLWYKKDMIYVREDMMADIGQMSGLAY
jgi:hypothetical protein